MAGATLAFAIGVELPSALVGASTGGSGSNLAHAASTILPGTSCPVFPADNVWNTNISGLAVDPNSATWLASMDSATTNLHPDFGPSGDPSVPYGIPYMVVMSPSAPLVDISFEYADESDPGPYPFGPDTPIEGGPSATGDRHAIMVNPSTCTLYELWDAYYSPTNSTAGSGAIWDLNSDALRPAGWTSADAAGLPILPGLVNYDEASSGVMDHAIRFTASCTQESYLWPARHEAGQANTSCPPMGARFRLDADFTLPASSCDALCQTVIATMKTYGLILADNGSNWYFQGVADTRWTETDVDQLKQIPASAFQAVDESCLEVDPDSGQALQPGTSAYNQACAGSVAPAIASITPSSGPAGGGTSVTITGSNLTSVTSVTFGGTPALLTADNATSITVTTPPGATGRVDVVVTTARGSCTDSGGYDYVAVATIPPAATPLPPGYDLVGRDGGVFVFPTGQSGGFYGSLPQLGVLVSDIVGMVPTSDDHGYFLVGSDGGVFAFGDAPFFGSLPGIGDHTTDITGIVPTSDNHGYFLVGSDGGVFAFGDAPFLGSLPGVGVHATTIIGIAATPQDTGYWLVAADGSVYAFGTADFFGSASGTGSPVSAIESTLDGGGYWIVTQNGSVYPFGDSQSFRDLPDLGVPPAKPVIGLVPTSDDNGYWLIGSDGGIFAFGDAPFVGSLPQVGASVTDIVGAVPTHL